MLHLLMSAGLVIVGLAVALLFDVPADMRVFGWVLVVVGGLGLAGGFVMTRYRNGGDRPGRLR